MKTYNLTLLGFGNVGRALMRLLLDKREELRAQYGIEWRLTGLASRRLGWHADAGGLDAEALLAAAGTLPHAANNIRDVREWLRAAHADMLFELTSVNVETGQPAIEHCRAALEVGANVSTGNKGVIVHGYHALRDLAAARGRKFFFEATVMGGTPLFSLFRETLPAVRIESIRALLNTTTSVILSEMEEGKSFDDALKKAQVLGIAETDPSADVDGWDATVKAIALATVLMDTPLKLTDVDRTGIRHISVEQAREARAAGNRIRLVGCIERAPGGKISARIRPEVLAPGDPLASASPTSLVTHFELDTLRGLTIAAHRQGPDTTAYGLFADFVNAVKGD